MSDPRQHVRPGQKLRISAQQINFLNGLMGNGGGFSAPPLAGWGQGTNIIAVRNTTNTLLQQGGVLRITGIEQDPQSNPTARRQFLEMPCVSGATPITDATSIVIAAEPIKSNGVGRAFVSGIAQAKIVRSSASHASVKCKNGSRLLHSCDPAFGLATVVWSPGILGEQWALVRFDTVGASEGVRLGKFEGAWPVGASRLVQLVHDSDEVEALNLFCPVGDACGGERWCAVFKDGGEWYLLAAECGAHM